MKRAKKRTLETHLGADTSALDPPLGRKLADASDPFTPESGASWNTDATPAGVGDAQLSGF